MDSAPVPASWHLAHPYLEPPLFVGRERERRMLTHWLLEDAKPLLMLSGEAGIGKTTLVRTWLARDVKPKRWPRVFLWNLHESLGFEPFLHEAANYLGGDGEERTVGAANELILEHLRDRGTLLVLTGFETLVEAVSEDRKREHAEQRIASARAASFVWRVATTPGIRAKVLITTSEIPRTSVKRANGARPDELVVARLEPLTAAEAAALLSDSGVDTVAKIEVDARKPLMLSLLRGAPSGLGGRYISVEDLVAHLTAHLSPSQRRLLQAVALRRHPTSADTLGIARATEDDLSALEACGLARVDKHTGAIFMHPQVSAAVATSGHPREQEYIHSQAAFETRSTRSSSFNDMLSVADSIHHLAACGQVDEALRQYGTIAEKLHRFAADELHLLVLRSVLGDATAMTLLQTDAATAAVTLARLHAILGNPKVAVQLGGLVHPEIAHSTDAIAAAASAQINSGRFHAAQTMLRVTGRGLAIQDARLLVYRGEWETANITLQELAALHGERDPDPAALLAISMWFQAKSLTARAVQRAYARKAAARLALLDRFGDSARNNRTAGFATLLLRVLIMRLAGDAQNATRQLTEALAFTRTYLSPRFDAPLLIHLADLAFLAGERSDAERYAEEAWQIATRGGFVLDAADALIVLSRLAQSRGNLREARQYAAEALRLATCDGPPDYTYKAAYDEATALLAKLEALPPQPQRTVDDSIVRLRDSPAEVADLLARLVMKNPGRINLLEAPTAAGVTDLLHEHRTASGDLPAFVARLREETAELQPNALWLAWIARLHEASLRAIGQQLYDAAAGGGDPRTPEDLASA